jgi:MATE family multidrug resistance protein
MAPFWHDVRRVLRLAVPVVTGELGWMAMTTVDTIMVGKLGAAAIGAIGVGSSAFYSFAIFGMGLLLGLDTLVSQSCGAGDREDCHRSLTQGVYLACALSVPLMLLFYFMPPVFSLLRIVEPVSSLAGVFLRVQNLGTLPLLLYGAFRRYLQGMGHVAPVMFTLVSANVVNWFGNWVLIQGHLGFPALGVAGSALSTCFARIYMAAVLGFAIWWYERATPPGFHNLLQRPDFTRLARLIRLGLPAATQILLEIAAFGAAAVLAGRLNPAALAAHQIALNCAALSFMVPLGISSAAAVSVGQAVGRGDLKMARRNGYIAIGLACSFMACSALAFFFIPKPILHIYTNDEGVLATGTGLLAIAALFQLFDGTQTVATGALRGLGDTRGPMFANLAGYWLFGLPIGYALCFHFGMGVYGLWWGLTLALIVIAIVLLWHWQRRSHVLVLHSHPEPVSSL